MKPALFLLSLLFAGAAAAQTAPAEPATGPAPAAPRDGLWQRLTPDQRTQLWRSMTPEQRADLWRSLEPQDRRAIRERLGPGERDDAVRPWGGRRFERGPELPPMMMSPEERQQMREQIREANRLRRERMETERNRGPRRD